MSAREKVTGNTAIRRPGRTATMDSTDSEADRIATECMESRGERGEPAARATGPPLKCGCPTGNPSAALGEPPLVVASTHAITSFRKGFPGPRESSLERDGPSVRRATVARPRSVGRRVVGSDIQTIPLEWCRINGRRGESSRIVPGRPARPALPLPLPSRSRSGGGLGGITIEVFDGGQHVSTGVDEKIEAGVAAAVGVEAGLVVPEDALAVGVEGGPDG